MTGGPADDAPPETGFPWWRQAVIYQIYPRSFADSDGDGVGDIRGIRSRLPYLHKLGVDALWLTPWYRSPMRDGGYDVADHRSIDPLFGTLDDARALVADARAVGLRVILDIVANHSSDQHPWFQAALTAPPGSAQRDRYLFRDGRGAGGEDPPNDWLSAFGGRAWTRVTEPDGRPGQWYLHLFAPEQPDFNWDNAEVRDEFEAILRFWLDLGVDGLRIDAASAFAKHPDLPDYWEHPDAPFAPAQWENSPLWDVDGVHEIFQGWRKIADSYDGDRVFVGEVIVNGPDRLARYLRPDELHTAFNLDYLKRPWRAQALRACIDATLATLRPVGAPATWVLSNHDEVRHVTRYGRQDTSVGVAGTRPAEPSDLGLGTRRARAAILLMLALPGSAYLYQGEELGVGEVEDLPEHLLQDPVWQRSGGRIRGRDGCRVPLPWSGEAPPFGFTTGRSWLPQPRAWSEFTVEAQTGRPGSMLELYRAALRLRRRHPGFRGDDLRWTDADADAATDVLVFDRGHGLRCAVNLSTQPYPLTGRVLLTSAPLDRNTLGPDSAAWLQLP